MLSCCFEEEGEGEHRAGGTTRDGADPKIQDGMLGFPGSWCIISQLLSYSDVISFINSDVFIRMCHKKTKCAIRTKNLHGLNFRETTD